MGPMGSFAGLLGCLNQWCDCSFRLWCAIPGLSDGVFVEERHNLDSKINVQKTAKDSFGSLIKGPKIREFRPRPGGLFAIVRFR